MAKRVHNEPTSSRMPLIALSIAGLAVAALVVWALTRSVQPAPANTSTVAATNTGFSTTANPSTPVPSPPTGTGATGTAAMPPMNPGQQPQQTSTLSPLPDLVPPPGTLNAEAAVPRVSAEDLRSQVSRGAVTVLDVRDAASYAQGHIPGSIHIPFSRVEAEINSIPRDKPIVTYCT